MIIPIPMPMFIGDLSNARPEVKIIITCVFFLFAILILITGIRAIKTISDLGDSCYLPKESK